MKIKRFLFLLLILIVSGTGLFSQQQEVKSDTILFRSFDQEQMEAYKKENRDYLIEKPPVSFWERFVKWLASKLKKIFKKAPPEKLPAIIRGTFRVILWGLGIFALVMVILTLIKGKVKIVQKEDKEVDLKYTNIEDRQDVDWQRLIDEEIRAERFNLALRLLFLQTIQLLNQKELIVWKKDKTNYDYIRELRKSGFDTSFANLMRFYNFGWFGDFKVEEREFNEIQNEFKVFQTSVL